MALARDQNRRDWALTVRPTRKDVQDCYHGPISGYDA